MNGKVGDTIVVESGKVAQPGRSGVIEDVLGDQPPRFRVRWEDGRTTIFAPSSGSVTIKAARRKKAAASKPKAAAPKPKAAAKPKAPPGKRAPRRSG